MSKKKEVKEDQTDFIVEEMNDLALRIYEGQSPDLPVRWRVERIVKALKSKGYDTKGLAIPGVKASDIKKFA